MDSQATIEYPSVRELRRLVKKRERERFSAMWFLEPIQAYFSYVLIRLGLNSIHVTVLWFIVAFVGYGVNCVGTAWAFVVGSLLLFVKTILDGCDGEVARFRKQFVSETEDMRTFINGVYLDKAFHIIEKPFWGLSLSYGLFAATGEAWYFAAGVSIGVFHGFCRHHATLQADIPRQFEKRIQSISWPQDASAEGETKRDPIPVRIFDKLNIWMRNGKRFNLLILVCSLGDLVLSASGQVLVFIPAAVISAGILAPLQMAYVIVQTMGSQRLITRALHHQGR